LHFGVTPQETPVGNQPRRFDSAKTSSSSAPRTESAVMVLVLLYCCATHSRPLALWCRQGLFLHQRSPDRRQGAESRFDKKSIGLLVRPLDIGV